MDSFRFDSRLFLVMALFGILSTQVTLAEDETEDDTTTEVSMAASAVSQDLTEETTTSLTNGPEAGASISVQTTEMSFQGAGGQESATSAREPNTEETVSLQSQAATDETRITSAETEKNGTPEETTAIFTGTSSTGEKPTTASVHNIATITMESTTSLGQFDSQKPAETATIVKEQEQSTTVISSPALSGNTPPSSCDDLNPMKMNCTNTIFNINGSICKRKNSYSKRSLYNSKQYTYIVKVYFSDEAHPSEISEKSWDISSDKVYENGSLGVAEHLKREWTNDTFVIKLLPNVDGVIILEVPGPMTLDDVKKALHTGFMEVIIGSQLRAMSTGSTGLDLPNSSMPTSFEESQKLTPDDSSSSAPKQNLDGNVRNSDSDGRVNIWEAHLGLFLTVIILISVCIVITIMCFLCMKWRGRGRDKHPDKQPISMEEAREAPTAVSNPIPDAEMIQDEAPMQERENPAVTPNGGGQHISKADEDNGWVVPLDELSKAEKEKPEVENTRL